MPPHILLGSFTPDGCTDGQFSLELTDVLASCFLYPVAVFAPGFVQSDTSSFLQSDGDSSAFLLLHKIVGPTAHQLGCGQQAHYKRLFQAKWMLFLRLDKHQVNLV